MRSKEIARQCNLDLIGETLECLHRMYLEASWKFSVGWDIGPL